MTDIEKFATLAKAILELAKEAATEWDYDGEQMIATGIMLDCEDDLKAIIKAAQDD